MTDPAQMLIKFHEGIVDKVLCRMLASNSGGLGSISNTVKKKNNSRTRYSTRQLSRGPAFYSHLPSTRNGRLSLKTFPHPVTHTIRKHQLDLLNLARSYTGVSFPQRKIRRNIIPGGFGGRCCTVTSVPQNGALVVCKS